MKVRLQCTYYNEKKRKMRLLAGGSAELVEPPKRSERD